MKNLIIATVAVIAVSFAATNKAEARSKVRFSFRNGGLNVAVGSRSHLVDHDHRRIASRRYSRQSSYNPYRIRNTRYRNTRYVAPGCNSGYLPAHTWHDTSHWDYIPSTLRRYGNHYDYVPGRYIFHREGHVHHNHP